MAVQADFYVYNFFDAGNQFPCGLWHDEPGHILDADGITVVRVEFLGHVDESLGCVNRTRGIGQCALQVCPDIFYLLHRLLHVADIVQSIKDPEYVHAIVTGRCNKSVDNIVRIVAVPDKILPPEKHLDRCLFQFGLEGSETVPGIVI